MTSDAIREMRALLAARTVPAPETAPPLARALQSMFPLSPRRRPGSASRAPAERAELNRPDTPGATVGGLAPDRPQDSLASDAGPSASGGELTVDAAEGLTSSPGPLPPEAVLAAFGPRLSTFGRRHGTPGAPPARPLEAEPAAPAAAISENVDDRRLAASASEIPYFDDDLRDDPAPPRLSRFGLKRLAADEEPPATATPPAPTSPPQELQRAFLLADLAAKLASHRFDLDQRLASAPAEGARRAAVLAELAATLAQEGVRLKGKVDELGCGSGPAAGGSGGS